MYSQLIYVSKRKPSTGPEELQQILDSSEKNNPLLEITGVLLYSHEKFIGFFEGKYDHVMRTYHNVKKDGRHEDVKILSMKKNQSKSRLFPVWIMGGKSIDDEKISVDSKLLDSDRAFFESVLEAEGADHNRVITTIKKLFI